MTRDHVARTGTATNRVALVVVLLAALLAADLVASGQAGIYGVIERVVFEPDAKAPERVQLWGAFAIVEVFPAGRQDYPAGTRPPSATGETAVPGFTFTNFVGRSGGTRGYLYFKASDAPKAIELARREWADLASVAGKREAVAFGYWDRFRGDKLMRIRDAGEKPADPDPYYTDLGVTKLPATGAHAAIVANLQKLAGGEQ